MGQALRYVLFLTFESMILECEQPLFFFSFESQYIRARTGGQPAQQAFPFGFGAKRDRGRGFSVLIAREIKRKPKKERGSLTLAPLVFLLNRTETLATQANEG